MRISPLNSLLFVVPLTSVLAQTPALQMNVVYECRPPFAIKVLSCTGNNATDVCDVQSFNGGRPFQRGKSTYPQVMGLLPQCHVQTPAEAQAAARGAMPPAPGQSGAGPGGFKVGDTVRVLIDGWGEARVIAVHGSSYVVHLANGIDVSKSWPFEVRRVGKLTAEDHAAGQYDANERVQVRINGQWHEGLIKGQDLNMYSIKVPGFHGDFDTDIFSTTPENIRISNTPPPPPPAERAAGQVPKPGLASCGAKYDGRWEHVMGGLRIVFRSGQATVTDALLGRPMAYECFAGGGEIVLYKAGSFTPSEYTLEVNNDGTLQTDIGALKKMGN